jgi:heat shock protein HslJ
MWRPTTLVGDWEASAIPNGVTFGSPLPGTRITARFADDGSVSGSTACNVYRGSYSVDGEAIAIGPPASTRKACLSPEGVMEQEAAYLAALPTAVRYRLEGNSLDLFAADGTYVISYARVTTGS